MNWKIEFDPRAAKELAKLDKTIQARIFRYLDERISTSPLEYGSMLKGSFAGLRKYRLGDYRLVCDIKEEEITVLVLRVCHRSKVYGGH